MFLHLEPNNQIEGKLYQRLKNPLKKGLLMTLQIQSRKYQNLAMMSPLDKHLHWNENQNKQLGCMKMALQQV
jgi:hypothetical protein